MSDEEILWWVIFVLVAAYNGTIFYLMLYLERAHRELWLSFGGKGYFATGGYLDSYRFLRTGFFAVFQGRHRMLNDGKVTALVFAIRVMLIAIAALIFAHMQMKGAKF